MDIILDSIISVSPTMFSMELFALKVLKQPLRGVPRKRCSELKICSKFTGEHPCRSMISLKLLCNFIEIILRHGCSPVNLLHIFRTPFLKNTSEWLLLKVNSFQPQPQSLLAQRIRSQIWQCKVPGLKDFFLHIAIIDRMGLLSNK